MLRDPPRAPRRRWLCAPLGSTRVVALLGQGHRLRMRQQCHARCGYSGRSTGRFWIGSQLLRPVAREPHPDQRRIAGRCWHSCVAQSMQTAYRVCPDSALERDGFETPVPLRWGPRLLLRVSAIIFLLTFPAADSPQEGMGFEPWFPECRPSPLTHSAPRGGRWGLGMRNAHPAAKESHLYERVLHPS